MQKNETALYHSQKFTQDKDLYIRPETIKSLWGNIGSKLLDIDLGDDILDLTPKAKMNSGTTSKDKKLLHGKGNHQQNERQTA